MNTQTTILILTPVKPDKEKEPTTLAAYTLTQNRVQYVDFYASDAQKLQDERGKLA